MWNTSSPIGWNVLIPGISSPFMSTIRGPFDHAYRQLPLSPEAQQHRRTRTSSAQSPLLGRTSIRRYVDAEPLRSTQ
ncbi:hypothetical protein JOF29_001569 [Kribbella aluminosa]|uniref:Uncharacterized protein n=1 Tax=Kribbella aluminosa TaxID=416017 RepID=A0ABS4UG04_9ACTN|nr:hypothetical protein [Kribbella aluminosa]MBP2350486.1 hypothetical protein [Kribbella aluminosa]